MTYFDSIRCYASYTSYCVTINKHGCFSWENVFGTPQKPWLWAEEKQKALVLLGLASGPLPNAVNSSVVPSSQENEVLEGKFVTWTLRLSPKRQLSFLLNFFFPLVKLFLNFVVSVRFRAKNVGYSTGLSQVCATSYWWSCGTDVTDGRSCDYYVTTKISSLDGYQICLAMVLRYKPMVAKCKSNEGSHFRIFTVLKTQRIQRLVWRRWARQKLNLKGSGIFFPSWLSCGDGGMGWGEGVWDGDWETCSIVQISF